MLNETRYQLKIPNITVGESTFSVIYFLGRCGPIRENASTLKLGRGKTMMKIKSGCYFSHFVQGNMGQILIRLNDAQSGPGVTLTLHQIASLGVPLKDIPNFNYDEFVKFYDGTRLKKLVYDRIISHEELESQFLQFLEKCIP